MLHVNHFSSSGVIVRNWDCEKLFLEIHHSNDHLFPLQLTLNCEKSEDQALWRH